MFLYMNKQYFVMNKIDFLNEASLEALKYLINGKSYLREIAEETGLAPSSVHKIMKKFLEKKIVVSEKTKNLKFFALNYDSPLTRSIVKLVFVNKILDSKAFRKLIKIKPSGVFLFGSAAKGTITADSDIDLAVYFTKKPDSFLVSAIKRELSSELKKEIQLVVLTPAKIDSMKKNKTELPNQIKNNSVLLFGEKIE